MKYIHDELQHNLKDPEIIIPKILNLFNPRSVVDVGCGVGNFLYVCKSHGVKKVLGVDGSWARTDLLNRYLGENEFLEFDLEQPLNLNEYYDLVISLEVAEHLSPDSAKIHVKNLVNAGKIILFSAAVPFQPGQNHINEQWLSYWVNLFETENYVLHNVLRPLFWESSCQTCYKQNMVIFAPKGYAFQKKIEQSLLTDVVHKELYDLKVRQLEDINRKYKNLLNGHVSLVTIIKMIFKRILGIGGWNTLKKNINHNHNDSSNQKLIN
ncbi:MAG: class I SAM-dependent methyltransferase [Phaeodactylibacter xiamenensis]|uniref:class I SAM-dependent methyltransferase n=1 Tax=Phaeodactylibacter xiamenensis TaxID=1524460 RepID=UPI00069715F0|nr:methyltransferase domain-containing protein [Phaeodactylibacter xiamenensis]MCR9053995.1 class I SAM-dependent methyltransferase [bacterium]